MINYNPLLADIAQRIRAALPSDFADISVHAEIDAPQEGADNIAIITMASMTALDIGRPTQGLQNYTMTCNVGIALSLNPADYARGHFAVSEKQAAFAEVVHQVALDLRDSEGESYYIYTAWLDPTTQTVDSQAFVATYNIIATIQF